MTKATQSSHRTKTVGTIGNILIEVEFDGPLTDHSPVVIPSIRVFDLASQTTHTDWREALFQTIAQDFKEVYPQTQDMRRIFPILSKLSLTISEKTTHQARSAILQNASQLDLQWGSTPLPYSSATKLLKPSCPSSVELHQI